MREREFLFPITKGKKACSSGRENNSFFCSLLGNNDGHLDAAAALFRVDKVVLAGLLRLPRDLARGLVVVELLDDEALGVLKLLLGLEADRLCSFFFFFFGF